MKFFLNTLLLVTTVFLFACSSSKKLPAPVASVNNTPNLLTTLLADTALQQAHIGVAVYQANKGGFLYQHNSHKLFVPASNTKIFTCYAGMKYLADSLKTLEYVKDAGGITVRFTGDPTLLHPDYEDQPALQFLQKHANDITVVNSLFTAQKWGNGWAWNDYDADYMPERSAAPVYGNTLLIRKAGNTLQYLPQAFKDSVEIEADIRTGNFFIERGLSTNKFSVKAGKNRFSSTNMPFVTSTGLAVALLNDTLKTNLAFADAQVTATNWQPVYNQPTDSMLKTMMHISDNFFAEQTLLMAALQRIGYMNEAALIDTLLKTDLKQLPQKPRWVDGSGLSRYNLFSPEDFVFVLERLQAEHSWNRISKIFATGGTGTLSSYYKPLAGKIFAKTGTLSGQVALSGYLITASGQTLIFSVLVNNHTGSATAVRKAVEKFLTGVYAEN
jgi:serine-type D-Ala-D-Ala carboxypeptidase/endopeptidase (penicillin-binding protein 4)